MSPRKAKWSSFVFVLLLALSGASFGFLVGLSNQRSISETTEQLQEVSEKVQVGGAAVLRGADAVRRMLVR